MDGSLSIRRGWGGGRWGAGLGPQYAYNLTLLKQEILLNRTRCMKPQKSFRLGEIQASGADQQLPMLLPASSKLPL